MSPQPCARRVSKPPKKKPARKPKQPRTPAQSPEQQEQRDDHGQQEQAEQPDSQGLPVGDLALKGGGAWKLKGSVKWKKSGLDTFEGQPAIRVFYGKNSGTSQDPGVGGMAMSAAPEGLRGREAKIAFDVFFDKGWHFSRGGKIGGFFIGHGAASGYEHSPNGSSHRIMWQKDGGAISYIYPPSGLDQDDPELKASGHGVGYFHDLFPAGTLKVGQWNSMVLGVKLNTFAGGKPNADGVAFLEINGVSGSRNNIRWTRSPDLLIESFDLSTFFGGPDPAVKDCTAYFRNFRMIK